MIFLLAWFSASTTSPPFSSDSGLGGPGNPGISGPEDDGGGRGGATSLTGDFRIISGVASRIGIGVVDSLLFEESISVVVLGILSSTILIGFDWKKNVLIVF